MSDDRELHSKIKQTTCNFFIDSSDFNGIPVEELAIKCGLSWPKLQEPLGQLVLQNQLTLAFGSHSQNPHIMRIPALPVEKQVDQMRLEDPTEICVYPNASDVSGRIGTRFDERPFSKRLALAEPQLVAIFFELVILERYFRDPRYHCWFGDSNGHITIGDEAYLSDATLERDKISLRFGIGYDVERRRVVVVYLYELAKLSPEHQQAWLAMEVTGPCTMNSDFERATLWGQWGQFTSVYAAFIQEQIEINRLSVLLGKPHFFRQTFRDDDRPVDFRPMLRPTQREYEEFMHLLDKMLSDNIDKRFFENDVPLEERIERSNGEFEVRVLNTLTLLERWLKKKYRNADGQDVSSEIVKPLKAIRQARQPTAHSIRKNEFDQTLPTRQDKILGEVKTALTIFRLVLSSHPRAKGYSPPEWLDGDNIVFF